MRAQRSFNAAGQRRPWNATVETEVVEGRLAEALIRVAQMPDAREILVGSRRLGRFRAMVGSVSDGLLEQADRPVVIVNDPLTAPEVLRAHAAGTGSTSAPHDG
jgi:nucleotide-binding universal stress UspA family protein